MNRLCDVSWSDEASMASVFQMAQGSTWHRVLLLGGAGPQQASPFAMLPGTTGSRVLVAGGGRCCFLPQLPSLSAEHTYSAESLVSNQTT